jgi:uncharacterized protein (DUF2336 family)
VEKLDAAGQLRPGYLLRALREHKLSLFETALAQLAGVKLSDLRKGLTCDTPEILALACLAAGIDRSVFPTVLGRVREMNRGLPSGGPKSDTRALDIFSSVDPAEAVVQFNRRVQEMGSI